MTWYGSTTQVKLNITSTKPLFCKCCHTCETEAFKLGGNFMTFEEKEYIKIPNTQDTFVYFLLDGLEVVYVGKTINNLSRPLSHRDKKYDSINLIYCPKEKLEETEDFFIQKYKTKYKLVVNGAYNF